MATKNDLDAILAPLREAFSDVEWGPQEPREIQGLRLVRTCTACPEQYDVFNEGGQQVGYLRLRHGEFRADVPDCGGVTVYEAEPAGDGLFEADERDHFLTEAVSAIIAAQQVT